MKKKLTVALLAGLAMFSSVAQPEKRTLVISTYPVAPALFDKLVYTPFKAICNCDIVVETGANADRLAKLEARRANPVVDLVLLSDFGMLEAANKGLVQPLDYSKLKNYPRIYPAAKNPIGGNFAVGYTLYSVGLVYRTDKIKSFTSWKDFWREDLKGRISLPDISTTQGPLMLNMANMAWGGKTDDYATGLAKVVELKNNVVTYSKSSSQQASLFAQDEIWAAPIPRFVWAQVLKIGMPLKWITPAEGAAAGMNVMSIVKQSKNADLAYQLMDFWLSKEVQTALATELVDSPVNQDVQLTGAKAEFNTYGADTIKNLKFVKPEIVLQQRAAWNDKWNKAMAK